MSRRQRTLVEKTVGLDNLFFSNCRLLHFAPAVLKITLQCASFRVETLLLSNTAERCRCALAQIAENCYNPLLLEASIL